MCQSRFCPTVMQRSSHIVEIRIMLLFEGINGKDVHFLGVQKDYSSLELSLFHLYGDDRCCFFEQALTFINKKLKLNLTGHNFFKYIVVNNNNNNNNNVTYVFKILDMTLGEFENHILKLNKLPYACLRQISLKTLCQKGTTDVQNFDKFSQNIIDNLKSHNIYF